MDGAPGGTRDLESQAQPGSMVDQYLNAMRVLGLENDERCAMLAHCQSFFLGTQHDHAALDWNAIPRDPGVGYLHERLKPQGFVPVNSSLYSHRKPDAPVPLSRQVVSRFTEMLLGEGRRPGLRAYSDPATEEFLEACFADADVWDVLSESRDLAGSCGSAAIAVGLVNGYLTCEVLNPKHIWVPEWDSSWPGWRPKVVVEQLKVAKQVMDPENRQLKVIDHWRTRAWTTEEVIYYEDIACGEDLDEIPIAERRPHKLGVCPVVWHQNTRSSTSPDGSPDCQGTWPLLDKLDRLQSQVYKAAVANADPTIVIKEERQHRNRSRVIQKGSQHVIPVSTAGEVKYLEISGSSIEVGLAAINALVSEILQTVECVVISPEYAKAYQSGEALQILWRSMESRANRLRVTLGNVIRELCYLFLKFGNAYKVANAEMVDTEKDHSGIVLPPRRVVVPPPEDPEPPVPGEPPTPAGEPEVKWETHAPGNVNAYIALEWPPYWTPTAAQIQQMAQALSTATTSKQVISRETAVRQFAQMMGHDGDEEMRRIEEEAAEGMAQFMNMGAMTKELDDEDGDDPFDDQLEDEEDEDDDAEGGGGLVN